MADDEEWLPATSAAWSGSATPFTARSAPWTPAVHALLEHLAPRLPHIPRVLGFDEPGPRGARLHAGRVIEAPQESLTESPDRLHRDLGQGLPRAVADFTHPGPWRYFPVPQPTLIGHNDIAPYNACFDGDDLAGVFDWDLSGPTNPLNELAFIAWNCVPLWADIGAYDAARRLALIAETYGGFAPSQLLLAVPGRIQLMMDGIAASAAAGDPGWST